MEREKLGEFLVEKGLLDQEKLITALEKQKETAAGIDHLQVQEGYMYYLKETELIDAISTFFNLEIVRPEHIDLSEDVLCYIPEPQARRYGLIPLLLRGENELLVACTEPIPSPILDNLRKTIVKDIQPVLVSEEDFQELYRKAYPESKKRDILYSESKEFLEEPIEAVDRIVLEALEQRATDVHFEPEHGHCLVRARVDGVLHTILEIPKMLTPPILSRIKVLSNIDIANRLEPQEGAYVFSHPDLDGAPINIRVCTIPGTYGEKAVLRLLPPQDDVMDVEELGMMREKMEQLFSILHIPHGLVLITGPAASGKSTTLYSLLNMLKSDAMNISTIEDPVEILMSGINQFQIGGLNRLTFPQVLRALLRQDPDILMIGEIRDLETAQITLRAAITGHLVFATLHTTDSPSAFTRLLDMGCEAYLAASAIRAVVSQRLVRLNCTECTAERPPHEDELEGLKLQPSDLEKVWYGRGCNHCNGSGYYERTGLFEILPVTEELHDLIVKGANPTELRDYVARHNIPTLRQNGITKIQQGITTPDELIKATMVW